MSVAEAEIIEQEAGQSDGEYDSQISVVDGLADQGEEISAAFRPAHQQWKGYEQGGLGQGHKLQSVEMLGRREGEWLLRRVEEGGDDRIEASEPVIDRGCILRHTPAPLACERIIPAALASAADRRVDAVDSALRTDPIEADGDRQDSLTLTRGNRYTYSRLQHGP